jgi:hypothetical protein
MVIRIELCETCRFYQPMPLGRCARFPAAQPKQPWDWCGEHQRDETMICGADGPIVERDKAIERAIQAMRGRRGAPPKEREPLRMTCLRAKAHAGKHANYAQEWE